MSVFYKIDKEPPESTKEYQYYYDGVVNNFDDLDVGFYDIK